MIQRIQTIYLLVAFIASVLTIFFPIAEYHSELVYMKFYIYQVLDFVPKDEPIYGKLFNLPFIIIEAGLLVLIVATILKYKKRLAQIRLVNFAILLNIVHIVLMFFYTDKISKDVAVTTRYTIGAIFPLISLVFLVLANRGIRRDERLVRSLDRLR
jgi:hypothetical protein